MNKRIVKFPTREVEFNMLTAKGILDTFNTLTDDEKVKLITLGITPTLNTRHVITRRAVRVQYTNGGTYEFYCVADAATHFHSTKEYITKVAEEGREYPFPKYSDVLKIDIIHHLGQLYAQIREHCKRKVEVECIDGRIITANSFAKAAQFTGYNNRALYQMYVTDVIPPYAVGVIKEVRLLGPAERVPRGMFTECYLRLEGSKEILTFPTIRSLLQYLQNSGLPDIGAKSLHNKLNLGGAYIHPGLSPLGFRITTDKSELTSKSLTTQYYSSESAHVSGAAKLIVKTTTGEYIVYRTYVHVAKQLGVSKETISEIRDMAVINGYTLYKPKAWIRLVPKEKRIVHNPSKGGLLW